MCFTHILICVWPYFCSMCLAEEGAGSYEWIEGLAIAIGVLVIVLVSAINDYGKEQQFRILQNRVKDDHKIPVIRNGVVVPVPVQSLLVGDICLLRYGTYCKRPPALAGEKRTKSVVDLTKMIDETIIFSSSLQVTWSPLTESSYKVRNCDWTRAVWRVWMLTVELALLTGWISGPFFWRCLGVFVADVGESDPVKKDAEQDCRVLSGWCLVLPVKGGMLIALGRTGEKYHCITHWNDNGYCSVPNKALWYLFDIQILSHRFSNICTDRIRQPLTFTIFIISYRYWGLGTHVFQYQRLTVWYCMVQYGAVWCCMVQYGTVWCCMVQYGAVWCCMVLYGTVWYSMVLYGTVLFLQFFFVSFFIN